MIGSTISHYKILEKLGEGGMGVVYKAHDIKLNRTVALKFLKPISLVSDEDKIRFVTEAQAAASLDHPNICTIYAIEEMEGQTFIAMAYIEGESLEGRIRRGPLKVQDVLDVSLQIAEGLNQAHQKGIVHRDIKSANVCITALGLVKIMDFGLARLAGRTTITKEGTTLGTPSYMSPEQARGEKVDHRSDIWSLGVVMYEMITGRLPFRGDYQEAVVYSILNEQPEPPTAVRTGVPMDLEKIVSKAMAKNANERYQHLDELLVDLRREKKTNEQQESSQKPPLRGKEYRKLSAIMFSDIVSYSKIMQQDEDLAMDLLSRHNQLVRDLIKKYNGREIKVIGDAFLVDFETVVNAVRCAIEIQKTISRYNEDQPEGRRILLRIGIHVGDIIVKENDVFGDGVNIASRIEPLAEPGGICISQEVYNLVKHKLDVQVISLGPKELKNIKDKIEIYEILVGSIAGKELAASRGRIMARSKPLRKWLIASILSLIVLAACLVLGRYWLKSPYPELSVETLQVHEVTTNRKVLRSALSPDGKYIAYIFEETGKRGISLQEVNATSAVTVVPLGTAFPLDLQFNTTGDHLFYWYMKSIYRIPVLGGTPEHFLSTEAGGPPFSVSPEEQRVAFFDFDTTRGNRFLCLNWVNSSLHRDSIRAAQGVFEAVAPAWRAGGKELACAVTIDSGVSLVLLNLENLTQNMVPSQLWKDISSVAWHPNQEDLVVAGTPKEGTGSLWLCSSRSGEVRKLSTDPSAGRSLSVDRGGAAIGMIKSVSRLSLWIIPDGDVAQSQRLSTIAGCTEGVAWFSKDVLVFPAREGKQARLGFFNVLSGMTEYKSLGKGDEVLEIITPAVSRSRQIFVPGIRKRGGFALMKYDRSTESVECVAEGYIALPSISNDENTIVYQTLSYASGTFHVMKISLPGGSPQQVVSEYSGCPTFSPDGKKVAFYALVPFEGQKGVNRYVLKTIDIGSGKQLIITDRMNGFKQHSIMSWTNDGKGIIYCGEDGGVSVLWLQDLKGAAARPLFRFPYGKINQFALAPDGKTVALSAWSTYSDVVVLTVR